MADGRVVGPVEETFVTLGVDDHDRVAPADRLLDQDLEAPGLPASGRTHQEDVLIEQVVRDEEVARARGPKSMDQPVPPDRVACIGSDFDSLDRKVLKREGLRGAPDEPFSEIGTADLSGDLPDGGLELPGSAETKAEGAVPEEEPERHERDQGAASQPCRPGAAEWEDLRPQSEKKSRPDEE